MTANNLAGQKLESNLNLYLIKAYAPSPLGMDTQAKHDINLEQYKVIYFIGSLYTRCFWNVKSFGIGTLSKI